MDTPLFDENSVPWSPLIQGQFQTFNMAAPQQHNTLAADAYAAATAMRDSLADNLAQWQILETTSVNWELLRLLRKVTIYLGYLGYLGFT